MTISIIAALAENRVIGNKGKIPWHLPEDFKIFKQRTSGHVVIMGRKTWESLPPKFRPLPNRHNIVVSTSLSPVPGAVVCRSYEEAIEKAKGLDDEIFVIGGAALFERALPDAERMFLSHVKGEYEGDVHFPEFQTEDWEIVNEEKHSGFRIVEYKRKKP